MQAEFMKKFIRTYTDGPIVEKACFFGKHAFLENHLAPTYTCLTEASCYYHWFLDPLNFSANGVSSHSEHGPMTTVKEQLGEANFKACRQLRAKQSAPQAWPGSLQ